MNNLVKNS